MKQFEIGKCYKKATKDRIWIFKVLTNNYNQYQGVCVKLSKFENYINDSDIWFNPKEVVEVKEAEFLKYYERAIEIFNNKIKQDESRD